MDVTALASQITEIALTDPKFKWATPDDSAANGELVVFEATHKPTGGRIEIAIDPANGSVHSVHAYMPDMASPLIFGGTSGLVKGLKAYSEGKYRRTGTAR